MSVGIYKCRYRGIYKCRWGFINVKVNLQMTVGICKCQRGFTNASILFRKFFIFIVLHYFLILTQMAPHNFLHQEKSRFDEGFPTCTVDFLKRVCVRKCNKYWSFFYIRIEQMV